MSNMKKTERLNLDFAALRTLKTVYDLDSFSLAALRLDVRQSTVSHTINRLRRIFDDPLFVRTGAGIAPTERCEAIAQATAAMLHRYDTLSLPRQFDPASAEFEVTLALSHQHRATVAATLLACLCEKAPGVRLRLMHARRDSHEDLLAGHCDLLITSIPYGLAALQHCHLFTDRYVCAVDFAHPIAARKSFTMQEFAEANHILVSADEAGPLPYIAALDMLKLPFNVVLDLPSASAIEGFLCGTDLVATIIERLAETLSNEVALVRPPFDHQMEVELYWTRRTDGLENMRWIRNLVIEAAGQSAI